MYREKLYNTWTDIKRRGKKQNVGVYDEWEKDYAAFKTWAYANGYEEGKVALIRIDNNLEYSPVNCKFIPKYSHGKKHGNHKSKLYSVWTSMLQRCNNPNNPQYENTGAKGVTVCDDWKEFSNFQEWAEKNGYKEGLLLDRKDLNQHFTPSNCMFITRNNHSSTKNSPIINKKSKENPMFKHGMRNTRIYHIWDTMKQRCLNNKQKDYKNYGRRGILICEEWLDFNNFYNWAMQNHYDKNLTLERINNNGNYEPENCCWKTVKEQARNKRTNHFITIYGKVLTIAELSEISGIPPKTLGYRKRNNWSEEDLLSPVDRTKKRKKDTN